MNHFKVMLHTPIHGFKQFKSVSCSIVSKAAKRLSETSEVGCPHETKRRISFFDIQ